MVDRVSDVKRYLSAREVALYISKHLATPQFVSFNISLFNYNRATSVLLLKYIS